MPGESLDAPEDLPKEAPRQMTFSELADNVPRVPEEAHARVQSPPFACDRYSRLLLPTRSSFFAGAFGNFSVDFNHKKSAPASEG